MHRYRHGSYKIQVRCCTCAGTAANRGYRGDGGGGEGVLDGDGGEGGEGVLDGEGVREGRGYCEAFDMQASSISRPVPGLFLSGYCLPCLSTIGCEGNTRH